MSKYASFRDIRNNGTIEIRKSQSAIRDEDRLIRKYFENLNKATTVFDINVDSESS